MRSQERPGWWKRSALVMTLGLVVASCGGTGSDEIEAAPTTLPTSTTTSAHAATTTIITTTTTMPATTTTTAVITLPTGDGERPAIDILEEYCAAIRADDMVRVTERGRRSRGSQIHQRHPALSPASAG